MKWTIQMITKTKTSWCLDTIVSRPVNTIILWLKWEYIILMMILLKLVVTTISFQIKKFKRCCDLKYQTDQETLINEMDTWWRKYSKVMMFREYKLIIFWKTSIIVRFQTQVTLALKEKQVQLKRKWLKLDPKRI